ncbi:hypothetical protein [uncultured Prevotella sp.]|uniref:hypothetical protein n=1 Tax=uncultured Prevotella sp. TaxID=159272 RepID=UPI00258652F1|nr:hypothetical protein [uncultured Prevotella sp.]
MLSNNNFYIKNKNQDNPSLSFTSLAAYPLPSAVPFRERALDGHDIRQRMVSTDVATS